MERLVRFRLEGGGSVVVQVDERQSGPVPAATPGELAANAAMSFEQALAKVRPIATAIVEQVKDLGPQKIEIELGLTFSAEAGVILAKSSLEGSCKLTLGWEKASSAV